MKGPQIRYELLIVWARSEHSMYYVCVATDCIFVTAVDLLPVGRSASLSSSL